MRQRFGMCVRYLLAAVAFLSCASVAQAEESPLGLFREACWSGQGNFGASDDAIRRAGWAVVDEAAHPALARLMAFSRSRRGAEVIHQTRTYGRPDRALTFVVLTEFTPRNARLVICHLYVFDATSPTPQRDLEEWLGVPTQFAGSDGTRQHWGPPPNMPEVLSVTWSFAPPDLQGAGGEHFRVMSGVPQAQEKTAR